MEKDILREEACKLKDDIEMLERHTKGIEDIGSALDGFNQIKEKLNDLYSRMHDNEDDLKSIEHKLRNVMHVDHCFESYYIKKKFDCRYAMEALPLPHGFRCHKKYQKDMHDMKSQMLELLKQGEIKQCKC